MTPFTESGSSDTFHGIPDDNAFETKLAAELKRAGYTSAPNDLQHLRSEATKIIETCGANVSRMTDRLVALIEKRSNRNLREAICETYVRALFKAMHPGSGLVGPGDRSYEPPPMSAPSETREPHTRKTKAAPPKPGKDTRDPSRAAEVQKIYLTSDGADPAMLSYHELIARINIGKDREKYEAMRDRIGSPPLDGSAKCHTLLKPEAIASIWG